MTPYRSRLGRHRLPPGRIAYLPPPARRWRFARFLAGAVVILVSVSVVALVVALAIGAWVNVLR